MATITLMVRTSEMWLIYSLLAVAVIWIVVSPLTCCRPR